MTTIADDDGLFRRIHPDQVVKDENTGNWRPSSGAFKDPTMSVDVEPILTSLGLNHQFCLRNDPHHSVVRFTAGAARTLAQDVVHTPVVDPDPSKENPAHAEVRGKKTPGTANRLRDAASWVHLNAQK